MIRVTLRLPESLHAALSASALENERSLNEEIIYRLRRSLALEHPVQESTRSES